MGLFTLFFAGLGWLADWDLQQNGIRAEGVVVADSGEAESSLVRYTTKDEETVTAEIPELSGQPGEVVTVIYDPEDPTFAIVEGGDSIPYGFIALFGLMCLALGVFNFFNQGRHPKQYAGLDLG